ncbi:MAG: YqgE/AlgH family protein [Rhizobiales bacterium]|nr:YqgE/AlgH family protein [Hyphomicrobiales bacterium]MDQ3559523.1 YqgE/AlgH family protein [Pseudomonadota bacterium]
MGTRTQLKSFLDGHLLIAMPSMADQRFARSVVYICAHSSDGAMGIVINKLADQVSFRDLLVQLEIVQARNEPHLPARVDRVRVHRGGPVETGRGFVLHSADFFLDNATLPIADGVCLTATLEVLRAISEGRGPDNALLALGYAGWAPGQLESEIQSNGWLHSQADPALIFDDDIGRKYDRALAKIGVEPAMLSMEAGHA